MYHIAICDDENKERQKLEEMCKEACKEIEIDTIFQFSSGEEILEYVSNKDNPRIDLLFLDIEMNGIDGIELKEKVLNCDKIWRIVFVSGYKNKILDAFGTKTIGYIEKPASIQHILKYIKDVEIEKSNNEIFCIEEIRSQIPSNVRIDEVDYLEANGSYTIMYTNRRREDGRGKETYYITKKLKYMEEYVKRYPFVRVHKTYYYEKNIQSDVVRILNSEGNVVCEYVYNAWGEIVSISGDETIAKKNPFRYRSYYYDNETGLYYVESRYYDPETGRFLNADKIEAIIWDYTNLNMYAYCGNDPVNYYDPSGEAAIYVKTFISSDINREADTYKLYALNYTTTQWIADMGKGGSNTTYIISNKEDFIKKWNAQMLTNVLIINAHGTPNGMLFGNEYFTTDDADKLEKKVIKYVWLLSCNTGHLDCMWENIARVLSEKITGVVIAPDGLARFYSSSNTYWAFVDRGKKNDEQLDAWYDYAGFFPRSESMGWVVYIDPKRYAMGWDVTYYGENEEINIFILSNFLIKAGYVSFK